MISLVDLRGPGLSDIHYPFDMLKMHENLP